MVVAFGTAFALQMWLLTQYLASNPILTTVLILASGVVDVATAYLMMRALDRSQAAYANDVTELLEASLEEYRAQTEHAARLVRAVGADVELQLAQAREALRHRNAAGVDACLSSGMQLASDTWTQVCENVVVAAVLLSKENQCKEMGVELVSEVSLPEELPIDDLELATVFFNLIDAALYECRMLMVEREPGEEAIERPTIRLSSLVWADQLFVEVCNPSRSHSRRHHRTKHEPDSALFLNLGTANVAEVAKRHGGIAEFNEKDGTKEARVLIPL